MLGGGGGRDLKKSLWSWNRPPISGPFDKLKIFLRKNVLVWVGGVVAQVEEPRLQFRHSPPPPGVCSILRFSSM